MPRKTISYKDSGVDIDANTAWIRKIQSTMAATHGPQVLGQAGAFVGMFRLDEGRRSGKQTRQPVLVGCDRS